MANTEFGCDLLTPSVEALLNTSGEVFVVPTYQRMYRWDEVKAGRLMSDIYDYYNTDVNEFNAPEASSGKNSNNKFVGTLIVVEDAATKQRVAKNKKAISIIDGQQRLTTFVLLLSSLYVRLSLLRDSMEKYMQSDVFSEDIRPNFKSVIDDVNDHGIALLRACLADTSGLPNFGREADDNWHSDNFVSDIPRLIQEVVREFDYSNDVEDDVDSQLCSRLGLSSPNVVEVFKMIGIFLDLVACGLDIEQLSEEKKKIWQKHEIYLPPQGLELASVVSYSGSIENNCKYHFNFDSKTNLLNKEDCPDVKKVARLLSFANFVLNSVYVAYVKCRPDNYLDIFESLNTAGSPLTPIETFVPEVFKFYQDYCYERLHKQTIKISPNSVNTYSNGLPDGKTVSPEELLNGIQMVLDNNEIKNSDAMVVSFSLIYSGEKCPEIPQGQRLFLKKSFALATSKFRASGNEADLKDVENFLYALYETVRWWCLLDDKKDMDKFKEIFVLQPKEDKHLLDQAKLALMVLRAANLTLAQSIACRYYIQFLLARSDEEQQKTYAEFLKVLRALVAFSSLWLSCCEKTAGIDSAFRDAISGNGSDLEPLIFGYREAEKKAARRIIQGRQGIVVADDVMKRFQAALNKRFEQFSLKRWQEKSLFASPAERGYISRFLLFAYLENSEKKEAGLRTIAKKTSMKRSYFTAEEWVKYTTDYDLEHIMPQKPVGDWKTRIDRPELQDKYIQQLGNVTLLPKDINRYLKNSEWAVKSLVYQLIASKTNTLDKYPKEVIDQIKKRDRAKFSKWIEKDLQDPVAEFNSSKLEWDSKFIQKRSLRMTEIIWETLDDFLNLKEAFGEAASLSTDEASKLAEGQDEVVNKAAKKSAKKTKSKAAEAPAAEKTVEQSEDVPEVNAEDLLPEGIQEGVKDLYASISVALVRASHQQPQKLKGGLKWGSKVPTAPIVVRAVDDGVEITANVRKDNRRLRNCGPYDRNKIKNKVVWIFKDVSEFDDCQKRVLEYLLEK